MRWPSGSCSALRYQRQGEADPLKPMEAPEPGLDLSDVLLTRTPLSSTGVEIRYRYERDRERQDAGSAFTHIHQASLDISLAVTDWLGLSATLLLTTRSCSLADAHVPR